MTITRQISNTYTYQQVQTIDGTFVDVNYPNLQTTWVGSRQCTNVPSYRQRIKDGDSAIGPYALDAYYLEKLSQSQFIATSKTVAPATPRQYQEIMTGIPGYIYQPGVIATNASKAEAIALTKIYNKIRFEQQHINSLASLAEIGDVVRQFGAPFAALVDLSNKRLNRLELERRGLKGTVVFKRAKWHRILASTWLEYAFGLAPLISDTKKVAEALARFKEPDQQIRRSKVSARGSDEAASTTYSVSRFYNGNIFYRTTFKDKSVSRVQYVVGLDASRTADFGSNQSLLDLLGVNVQNLAPAAWEALPWSWLADYFSNIGNIIDASVASTANVTWICKTVSSKHTRDVMIAADPTLTAARINGTGRRFVSLTGAPVTYRSVRTILSRAQIETLGIPPLYTELPTQLGQLANMVAVLFARKEKSSALWLF